MESDNESTSSNSSSSGPREPDVTVREREQIRTELSTMSFEDLQKLKQKVGSYVFNETIFGASPRQPKTNFKRANKNRPREASSKKRVVISGPQPEVQQPKRQAPRDPRFDPLCGSFQEKTFKSDYKFLTELKKKERSQLQKEYKEAEDPERKKKIKFVMQRIDNQIREEERKEKEKQKIQEEKRQIKETLGRGERPSFKKKSERKIEDLIDRYEELKSSNKLRKHMERRAVKLNQKERKKMNRNQEGDFFM